MAEPAAEQLVSGRYRLLRELGRGGMGSVWEAEDDRLGRRVAVKLMIQRLANDEKALRRFEREARAVANLRSPHIVQLLDFGVDRVPYMVLELLEGCELKERLAEVERLPLVTVARIVAQTGRALSAAHAAGIVHRDLKPANIFLVKDVEDEYVKVFDFGTAKALTGFKDARTLTTLGSILGTPHYMAPEQLSGDDDTDQRADLWSLGVVAYHALTGVHPHPGDEIGEVIQGIVYERHRPPSALDPDLPEALDGFFDRALAKSPAARFASARELAAALCAIADVHVSNRVQRAELLGSERLAAMQPPLDTAAVPARAGAPTRRGFAAPDMGPPSPEEADQAAASAWARAAATLEPPGVPSSRVPPPPVPRRLLPRTVIGLGALASLAAGGVLAWLALRPAIGSPIPPPAASTGAVAPPEPPASSAPPVASETSAAPSASASAPPPPPPRRWHKPRPPDIYEELDRKKDIYR